MNDTRAATVDREVPDVTDLAPAAPWRMQAIDPEAALIAFEKAAELLRKLVPHSIKQTRPQDWVKMGDKVYLQATGIERVAPLWGLWFSEPKVTREEYDAGAFGYIVSGKIGSRFTGVEFVVEGGRSSADPFFDAFDEPKPQGFSDLSADQKDDWRRKHRLPVDPIDVRKAAVTNWMTRGASMLTGLRGLKPADLEANGITGVAEVNYGSGKKGGDTSPADLKAARTKLGNDFLAAVGGEVDAAKKLLKECTAGKDFAGFDSVEGIKHQWQIDNARKKLDAHPVFGKGGTKGHQREPGEEG